MIAVRISLPYSPTQTPSAWEFVLDRLKIQKKDKFANSFSLPRLSALRGLHCSTAQFLRDSVILRDTVAVAYLGFWLSGLHIDRHAFPSPLLSSPPAVLEVGPLNPARSLGRSPSRN